MGEKIAILQKKKSFLTAFTYSTVAQLNVLILMLQFHGTNQLNHILLVSNLLLNH